MKTAPDTTRQCPDYNCKVLNCKTSDSEFPDDLNITCVYINEMRKSSQDTEDDQEEIPKWEDDSEEIFITFSRFLFFLILQFLYFDLRHGTVIPLVIFCSRIYMHFILYILIYSFLQ